MPRAQLVDVADPRNRRNFFGLLAFRWPGNTLVVIGLLFGAYALVDGIFAILGTIRAAEEHQRWWPLRSKASLDC